METELLDVFRGRAQKQTVADTEREADFLKFNDDFFSRSKNFKYCRLCKDALRAGHSPCDGVVAHHALRSLDGVRKCKYEETQQWLDNLVRYKDCLDTMGEIRPYVRSILQLYHTAHYDLHPPVVWYFGMLFPGEPMGFNFVVEDNPAYEPQEVETFPKSSGETTTTLAEISAVTPLSQDPVATAASEPKVQFKVSFDFFMSWFDVFFISEYFIVGEKFQATKPWALLGDDLYFDDLGYISLSSNLKDHFGVNVAWTDLRPLTVAQVYTRYFQ